MPRRRAQAAWLQVGLWCLLFVPAIALAQAGELLSGPTLLTALRDGGYVLYFRHTSTDFGQNDDRMTGFEDCAKQRNLLERGRMEARAIGNAIRRLEIPVGDVLASPFCRTRETAELIFGRARVEPLVRGGPIDTSDATRYAGLRKLLSTPVPHGTNRVIVSHGNPFRAIVGGAYLAEGEAAVVKPENDGFTVVARIGRDDWPTLAPPR